ncbi:MAG TPA: hypothetical protein VJU84_08485 [Pyrinomonadaceae bacterium]|nr:hypothetical protein [Pyrinomonadaceae bacterium]
MQVMQIPLTILLAQAWGNAAIEDLIRGFGEQPDAVFDFLGMHFTKTETRIMVVPYRNLEAWEQGVAIPGFPSIELRLTRAEHLAMADANPEFAALEQSVRTAAWSMLTTHPMMLKGDPPANVFAGGQLVDAEAE